MFNGYVLHTTPYKETSLIVKVFTKEHGIVTLIANGAKRPKSHFYNILQPFIPLLFYWKQRNIELNTLYKAEVLGVPYKLIGRSLFSALYINELLLKILPTQDPYVELFIIYASFLKNLTTLHKSTKVDQDGYSKLLEKNLRSIEKEILKAIGYELQLDRESNNGANIDVNAEYCFDLVNGLRLNSSLLTYKPNNISNTEIIIISGKSLLALHNDLFADLVEMKESKMFMRKILANLLGHKQLFTRKLFM